MAGLGYLGLLKREFQKLQGEETKELLKQQAAKLPLEADKARRTVTANCYLRLQLEDVPTGSGIEELYVLQDYAAGLQW